MNETEGNTERNENEFNYPRAVVRAGAVCGKLVFFSWKKKKKEKGGGEIKSCREPITLWYVSAINVFNPRFWSRMKSSKGKLLTVPFDRWFANRRREYLAMDREDSEGKVFSPSPFSFFHGIWILPTPLSDPGVPFRVTASNYEIIDEKRREKSRGSNRGESVGKNRMKYGKGGRGKLCELASWRDILRWFAPERQVLSAPDAEKRHSVEFLRFDLNLVIPKFAEFAEVWIITGCCADFADATWGLFFARAVCVCSKEDISRIMAKLVPFFVEEKFAMYKNRRLLEDTREDIEILFRHPWKSWAIIRNGNWGLRGIVESNN